jgi:aspartate carbamoyltransferase catalytic subunit
MGADAVVVRHGASGARTGSPPRAGIAGSVVNAGDGTHEHPTQALLDAFTLRRARSPGGRRPRRAAGRHRRRRAAQPGGALQRLLLRTLGAEVTLVAPARRCCRWAWALAGATSYDLDAVLPEGDAVMMLRVQRERMSARVLPQRARVQPPLRPRRAADGALPDDAIVMHPGPMNRGMEIAAEVADSAARRSSSRSPTA